MAINLEYPLNPSNPHFIPPVVPEGRDLALETSYLGTDIFSTLIFKKTKIERQADRDATLYEELPQIELESVILNVSKNKKVVVTEVQGRAGSVKEYISDGDYKITCRGVINTEQRSVAPVDKAEELGLMLSIGQSLEVAGGFLEIFNIHTVVVMDFGIDEMLGYRNQYSVKITMQSDTPIELSLVSSEV
jgi:hypothetical protein